MKSESTDEKLNIKLDIKSPMKSPKKLRKLSENYKGADRKVEQKSPDKLNKVNVETTSSFDNHQPRDQPEFKVLEKPKVELKIERKKSPKRIEKPRVNIFLEDSDEVDEFEKNATMEIKCKWSSPEINKGAEKLPSAVPAPTGAFKLNIPEIPVVVESPERSPVSVPVTENIFQSSSVLIEKSPTPSPPPQPTKVRNVCSFLSDIASGNMFSGLGFGSRLYDEDNGLKVENLLKLPELKKREVIRLDMDGIMEPDTTANKSLELGKSSKSSDNDTDSDSSSSSSSSDSDSDDTTSESEESSEESSDEDVPTFTRGFGRFDASSMPMVTQIKPTMTPLSATAQAINIASRFQPQQNLSKSPAVVANLGKLSLFPQAVIQSLPTAANPFPQFQFPIPFKIYSLRDVNPAVAFPSSVQPIAPAIATPAGDKAADKKPTEKPSERREKDRKRSRSLSRERDRKRMKDDRKRSPSRRRSPSPNKKRHNGDRRQMSSRRKDLNSHTSRTSHGSR